MICLIKNEQLRYYVDVLIVDNLQCENLAFDTAVLCVVRLTNSSRYNIVCDKEVVC
jgi:hypothetical protein